MDKPTPPDLLTARMSSSEYVLLGVWGQAMAAWGAAQEREKHKRVDWRGLALDLEQQAAFSRSQTAERAMLAAARGLRLMGASE